LEQRHVHVPRPRRAGRIAQPCAAIHEACSAAIKGGETRFGFHAFAGSGIHRLSQRFIDYAVMEKTQRAVVVPLDAGWSDVGSWSALHEAIPANVDGNVQIGDVRPATRTVAICTQPAAWWRRSGSKTTSWSRLKDAVLVAPKHCVQDVKNLVAQLEKARPLRDFLASRSVRPWAVTTASMPAIVFKSNAW